MRANERMVEQAAQYFSLYSWLFWPTVYISKQLNPSLSGFCGFCCSTCRGVGRKPEPPTIQYQTAYGFGLSASELGPKIRDYDFPKTSPLRGGGGRGGGGGGGTMTSTLPRGPGDGMTPSRHWSGSGGVFFGGGGGGCGAEEAAPMWMQPRSGTPGSQASLGAKSTTKSLLVVEDGFIRLDLDGVYQYSNQSIGPCDCPSVCQLIARMLIYT